MSFFSFIGHKIPGIIDAQYKFNINKNLKWEKGQRALIYGDESNWWVGIIDYYNADTGDVEIICKYIEGSGEFAKGTIDLYALRGPTGPAGTRGPSVNYYSEIIGSIEVPSIGDEILLRTRKRYLSWQKGQRIYIYTNDINTWMYGHVIDYDSNTSTLNILITEIENISNLETLSPLYIDIGGTRGVQGPTGPPSKWSVYGIATNSSQNIKKNVKTSIKFDNILQDDSKSFNIKNSSIIFNDKLEYGIIGIKFLTSAYNEGVLFLSLELVSRPNNKIIPDIRYNFVKTVLPQQPAVIETFPPIKAFESGDEFKLYAWFSGADVDVDLKMIHIYYMG